jgi:hypothetical protein
VAWQVLAGNDRPDPQLTERVKAILAKLDADDFRVRENALEELKKLGQPAASVLSKMDRSKLSLQQSSGVESFLSESAPLAPSESAHLADDRDFLLDVLYNDDPALVKLAIERLSKAAGRSIAFNVKADPAARAEAIAKLREEVVPSTLPKAPAASQPTSRPIESDRQRWQP